MSILSRVIRIFLDKESWLLKFTIFLQCWKFNKYFKQCQESSVKKLLFTKNLLTLEEMEKMFLK